MERKVRRVRRRHESHAKSGTNGRELYAEGQ